MEGRTICRLLIVLFCALSITFFVLYRKEYKNTNYLSDEFVVDAVENLSSSGVEIDPAVIDRKIPEKDIYSVEFTSVDAYQDKVVRTLVEKIYENKVTTLDFDMPDGVSVGIYDSSVTDRELGRIVMNDNDLFFRFSKTGINIDSSVSPNFNEQTDGISDGNRKMIKTLITGLSDSADFSYRICGSSYSDEYVFVSVIQVIDGYDIPDVFLNFAFYEGEVVDISGSWITGKIKPKYHNKLMNGVNVLYKLNLEKISKINEERHVYFLRKSEDGRFFVVPGWEITYTDKNGAVKKEYFEAL
ncbi:MAG: hypothetical protein E7600_07265 [Ruminococcaceae bacterium]|nr:hypothetical protein [Oscillospiraceae bacterium]